MSNDSGSKMAAAGLAVMLLAVSAGVGSGDFAVLLGLVGVLIGANLVALGVRRMGGQEPMTTHTAGVAAYLRHSLPVAGIILASSAVTVVASETGQVLCCAMLVVLLIGLCLINIPVALLGE